MQAVSGATNHKSFRLSRSLSVRSIMIDNGNGNKPSALTADEEILFLRGRLLQLEIKKRGEELQIYGADQSRIQQTTQVQFLVQDEFETPESFETGSDLAATPECSSQNHPVQDILSVRRHSPSAPDLPTNLIDTRLPPSTDEETKVCPHPPQPSSTHLKINSIPRKQIGSAGKASLSPHEPGPQLLPAVAEYPNPSLTAGQQYHPSPLDLQQKPPPKERQDSGYCSIASASSLLNPDQSSLVLPQAPEYLSFTPQAFGLPPIMSPQITEEPEFDAHSIFPSKSREEQDNQETQLSVPRNSPVQSEHKSQFSIPRKSVQTTVQAKRQSQSSIPSVPQTNGPSHSQSPLTSVPHIVEHRKSQSSLLSVSPPPLPFCSPPPPALVALSEKDYFGQGVNTAAAPLKQLKIRAKKSMLDIQGWQWGK